MIAVGDPAFTICTFEGVIEPFVNVAGLSANEALARENFVVIVPSPDRETVVDAFVVLAIATFPEGLADQPENT